MVKFKDRAEQHYAVGSIWNTSWGYDQTNVEFFEVVRETKGTVTLRAIASEVIDGRVFPAAGSYITDFMLQGNSTAYDSATGEWVPNPTYVRDQERGFSEKVCRKGKWGTLKISQSRTAFPYEGGGAYDTHAAGQPGH
jgi:hypothetical protein